MNEDIAIDLYCGLGGWAEGLLAEGFSVIGFDIERHDYGTGGYPGQLVLQDVLLICGAQFKPLLDRLRVIVASPPCTEPSYRAMPWKRAKALNEAGPPHTFIKLFEACFRIQREASEAAGRHIPLIVENVVGAQRWVGRAQWHFGSYYLWGDIPALMPVTGVRVMKAGVTHRSDGSTNFHGHKTNGQNWSRHAKNGETSPQWNLQGLKGPETEWRANGCRAASNRMVADADEILRGVKGFTPNGQPLGKNELGRRWGSKSAKRKAASAMIAKIPFPLARHIAHCFKTPTTNPAS